MTAAWPRRIAVVVLLCVLGMVAAAPVHAADCKMSLSTPHVDYGRLGRATLAAAGDMWHLPPRTVTVTVSCPEPRDMTLRLRGTPADTEAFRFTEHGRLELHLRGGTLDGEAAELGQVDGPSGTTLRSAASLPWLPDQGVAPLKGGKVAEGRLFTVQMDVQARVDDRALNVRDTTHWSFAGLIEAASADVAQELSLQANVQPGACQVDVVRHVSFGRLRSSDLDSHGQSTPVPATQSGQLRVLCDAPMLVAFRVPRDERSGTTAIPRDTGLPYAASQWFGLGKTPAGEGIGAYALRWSLHASSDQGELQATRSLDGGRSWTIASAGVLAEHEGVERIGYTRLPGATTGPLPFRTLDVVLNAEIYIAPRHRLSLDDEVEADGMASFEIIY
jgi:hypothetical protein